MRSTLITAAFLACVATTADANGLRIGTWNIANLHHEEGVPLREDADPGMPRISRA